MWGAWREVWDGGLELGRLEPVVGGVYKREGEYAV